MRRTAAAVTIALATTVPFAPCAAGADETPSKRAAIEAEDGTPVTFESSDVATEVFLAPGDVQAGTMPDPFVRMGVVPLTVKLAPGVYTVETASAKASMGHQRLFVEQGAPLRVEVRPGDASVKTIGTTLIGLGVVATILGVVAIVSISPNDQNYNRFGIGLPLVIGGAAGAGLGWVLIGAGSTSIVAPHLPPAVAPRGTSSVRGLSLVVRF
jgi:hypothetical protein